MASAPQRSVSSGELGLDEDVGDRDVGAGPRKRQCIGPSQSARSSGYERDASGKIDLERHERHPMVLEGAAWSASRSTSGERGSLAAIA